MWADAEEEDLPILPLAAKGPAVGAQDHHADRPQQQQHAPARAPGLPTQGPFVAYVGNLPFTATEADVRELFGALSIEPTGVKLPIEKGTDKHKGFAYVTFVDGQTLINSLGAHGREVQVSNRSARDLYLACAGRIQRTDSAPLDPRTQRVWRPLRAHPAGPGGARERRGPALQPGRAPGQGCQGRGRLL